MDIRSQTFAAVDFESAGAERGKTDVPVQIGMATWSADCGHQDQFVSYLKVDRKIAWSAQKVHGITTEDLADAPPLMMLWPKVKATLSNRTVVAHGYGTEKRYLRAFPAHGFGPWVDTLLLSRAAWPKLKSHALGSICDEFALTDKVNQLVPDKKWHDALYDSVASLILLEHLVSTFQLADQPASILCKPNTSYWAKIRREQ